MEAFQWLILLSWVFIIAGFITIFTAFLFMALRTLRRIGGVRGGGVVLIGPFPIVFGTDVKIVKAAILLTLALIIVVALLLIILPRLIILFKLV